jgi:hypothetical protein
MIGAAPLLAPDQLTPKLKRCEQGSGKHKHRDGRGN